MLQNQHGHIDACVLIRALQADQDRKRKVDVLVDPIEHGLLDIAVVALHLQVTRCRVANVRCLAIGKLRQYLTSIPLSQVVAGLQRFFVLPDGKQIILARGDQLGVIAQADPSLRHTTPQLRPFP